MPFWICVYLFIKGPGAELSPETEVREPRPKAKVRRQGPESEVRRVRRPRPGPGTRDLMMSPGKHIGGEPFYRYKVWKTSSLNGLDDTLRSNGHTV